MTFRRNLFSNAAATLSLSASCLLTAPSAMCVPGVMVTLTLNLDGIVLRSCVLMERPISVAMLQWGIVGVNLTLTSLFSLSTCWDDSRIGLLGKYLFHVLYCQVNWVTRQDFDWTE